MDLTQQGILLLMKCAITGESGQLPENFDLTEAYKLMKRHSVLPLGYAGACKCGVDKSLPVMQQLYKNYCLSALVSERQLNAASRIFEAFNRNGVDFMPVKGCNLKFLYPSPGLRTMGDADILVHMEQKKTIGPIMQQLGFEEIQESDHEWIWHSKALHVELHKRLVPSYDEDYYAYYGDGWKFASRSDGHHWYMTDEDQFIYVLTHFAKHYRSAGIGLSHALDIWVCLTKCPDMDFAYIDRELQKLGLTEFYQNIQNLIGAWFYDKKLTDKLDFMTQYLFDNGNWGTKENLSASQGLRGTAATHSKHAMRFRFWLNLIFPPLTYLNGQFPILRKAPVLLPAVWVWRWIRALLFRRKKIVKLAGGINDISDEKLSEREQALAYMGLHFASKE